ncbi:helix-turn-helix domain-containing protein [Sphingomonas sp.]|uniref:helix-turn-helix domain-containing protein n=1 Tax=Sphingomonas sp. TaxID=28214 RepID=UPI00286DBFF5|nr:helix-turn-helix domain-containing protein [Sphingomonas sp.]
MTLSIKQMIARCIERMRGGACATCDNREACPAGRWQSAFGPPPADRAPQANPLLALLGEFARVAEGHMANRRQPFRREVEAVIEPLLPLGEAGIDRVARELGVSRQTLYRRLKAEGTTFEELLDAKRRALALRYLKQEKSSVKAAAYRLGFSDPAAFSRAFKRWTGTSPSAA